MSVKMRQEVERKIVGAFVDSALKAGHRLSVSLERKRVLCMESVTERFAQMRHTTNIGI